MTNPVSGGGGGSNPMSGILSAGSGSQVSEGMDKAAAPNRELTQDSLKNQAGALNTQAASSTPNAAAAGSGDAGAAAPPSGAAASTTGANADPNAPRPAGL